MYNNNPDVVESDLQSFISRAPWLIRPDWSVISENQGLKTFRDRFTVFIKDRYGVDVEIAIAYEKKRPDFTAVHLGRQLHIVELKKPKHAFDDDDYNRLQNYLVAFAKFFEEHKEIAAFFADGWVVDLIADAVDIKDTTRQIDFNAAISTKQVVRKTWYDSIATARDAHAEFLDRHRSSCWQPC